MKKQMRIDFKIRHCHRALAFSCVLMGMVTIMSAPIPEALAGCNPPSIGEFDIVWDSGPSLSPDPVCQGDDLTLTGTYMYTGVRAGDPGGDVNWEIDGTAVTSPYNTSSLTPGTHTATAYYEESYDPGGSCGVREEMEFTILNVEITEPDENPVTDNNFTFDDQSPGECEVTATGTSGVAAEDPDLEWTLEAIAGATLTSNPDPAKGTNITFTYTTLPTNNSEFGEKELALKHSDIPDTCKDTQSVQIFFSEEENNNPGGAEPNWYYYWKQTSANYGTHSWEAGAGSGVERFEGGQWKVFLRNANESAAAGTWNNAEGIDFFANMCRHEERHRLDDIALWGASSDRDPANDQDDDFLPDDQEATLVAGHPYTNTMYGTYPDTFNYGEDPLRDCEDYCLRRQASWTNGSADDEDWATPGHQSSQ